MLNQFHQPIFNFPHPFIFIIPNPPKIAQIFFIIFVSKYLKYNFE